MTSAGAKSVRLLEKPGIRLWKVVLLLLLSLAMDYCCTGAGEKRADGKKMVVVISSS